MQTSKVILVGAILALAGCDGGFELGAVARKAPEQILLANGTVVAGAEGWCVDTATSHSTGDTAVVVLGSCAAIAHNASEPRPNVPGVFTVSVDSDESAPPTPEDLEGFFSTDTGRAALARNGRAESVEILETWAQDGQLYLRAVDQSTAPGTDPEIWRALFDLRGHFISVSLFGPADRPISRDEGLATLEAQVDRLLTANEVVGTYPQETAQVLR